ncbi:MAG: FAD-dependent oxidoreductase [Oscillospiraceae bacterium]|nr:FAD-dependent oxidoreductase [Oscillospiraceae bacterium]
MKDLLILGGGAAGSRAAMLAARAGFSVALIECGAPGGGAVREGYWPYKRLLTDAADLTRGREGFLGLRLLSESHVYCSILKRAQEETEKLAQAHENTMRELGVEIIAGIGRVEDMHDRRYMVSAGDTRIEARRLLIATGSVPFIPNIEGIEELLRSGLIITPKEVLYDKLPRRVIVAGGNIRALQIAAWFASHRSAVILTSDGDNIAEELDADVSRWLKRSLKGIEYLEQTQITAVSGQRVSMTARGGGRSVECDKIVIGAKRCPATRGMGLGGVGVAIENGAIITDLTCHTNLPDVYAAGDVNMRTLSALGAFCEAEACVSNMLGRRAAVAYRALPRIFDCGAMGASVGETEESARAVGYTPVCVKVNIFGRIQEGFVKLIADDKNRLIGAHICGWSGAETVWKLAAMIESSADLSQSARRLHPASVMEDAVQQALLKL